MGSRIGVLAIFFGILSCAGGAAAHPRGPNAPYVVTIEDDSGRELPTFHHQGETFVMGSYGDRYNIRVRNQTGRRIEAVVTVDGRDVVSGHVGDFVGERGYLIAAYDDLVIEGFRQSWESVAAFRFTNPGNSYSSRMGTPQNVGVIGVAVFPEREHEVARPVPRPQPVAPDDSPRKLREGYGGNLGSGSGAAQSAPSSARAEGRASAPAERNKGAYADSEAYDSYGGSRDNLGTEYGESVSSSAYETSFVRASRTRPADLITLRYDDHAGLVARGILPEHPPVASSCGPQAFPQNRFAAPPPPCRD
jgi:hypothetical protein